MFYLFINDSSTVLALKGVKPCQVFFIPIPFTNFNKTTRIQNNVSKDQFTYKSSHSNKSFREVSFKRKIYYDEATLELNKPTYRSHA